MTEERGRYDPHPTESSKPSSDPEPLGELLCQYLEAHNCTHLLAPSNPNGHPRPASSTTVRHRDG